jgi:hypothetical protein
VLTWNGAMWVPAGIGFTGPTGATGDVVGPASSTSDHLAGFDGVTGKLLKDVGAIITGGKLGLGGVSSPSVGIELPNSATSGEGLAYAWGTHSSRRWKENIKEIDDAIGKVSQLVGVEFDWKKEHGGFHDIGLIAEDVGMVVPEVVRWEDNGIDAKYVEYSKLVSLLVQVVKEQQKEIDDMRTDILNLRVIVDVQNI